MTRAFLILALLGACDPGGGSVEQVDPRAQPGGTVLPLQTLRPDTADGGGVRGLDGGSQLADAAPPTPEPFGAYESPSPDPFSSSELVGVKLVARWSVRGSGPWPEPAEAQRAAVTSLREATTARWDIEVAAIGRLRAEVATRGQTLPRGVALLAHAEHFGSALTWPDGSRYRLLPPGTLNNVLGDRRADVTPLTVGTIRPGGSATRLGLATRWMQVRSAISTVELELARLESAGRGAPLVCRMVLEIAGVEPGSEVCTDAELVVSASIAWMGTAGEVDGGVLDFEVVELLADQKLDGGRLSLPPARGRLVQSGLPGVSKAVFLTNTELDALAGNAVVDVAPPPKNAVDGLVAQNQSDRLLLLVVGGVVVGTVPPWGTLALPNLKKGGYVAQWQTYLGETVAPPLSIEVPTKMLFGGGSPEKPDAG